MFPRVGFAVSPLRGRFQALAAAQVARSPVLIVQHVRRAADRAAQVAQVAAGVQETTRPPLLIALPSVRLSLLVNMSPRSSALLIVEQIAPPSVHPSFIGAAARNASVKPLVQAVRLAVSV